MSEQGQLFRSHQVAQAPRQPGVYAWYCRFHIPDRNIQDLQQTLESTPSADNRREQVSAFLSQYLFRHFCETPYFATIKGPLKPRYEGHLPHVSPVSDSLVERIVANPERLTKIASLLKLSVPLFASPIYIGVARHLRDRLRTHVSLMDRFREGELAADSEVWSELPAEERADHTFARDVIVERGFDPSDMYVYVHTFNLGEGDPVDLENVLNRLNYPLCGRN